MYFLPLSQDQKFYFYFLPPVAVGLHLCPKVDRVCCSSSGSLSLIFFREDGGEGSGGPLCFSCICCSSLLGLHQEDGFLRTLILPHPHPQIFLLSTDEVCGEEPESDGRFLLCSQWFYSQASPHQPLAICQNFQIIFYCCCCQIIQHLVLPTSGKPVLMSCLSFDAFVFLQILGYPAMSALRLICEFKDFLAF